MRTFLPAPAILASFWSGSILAIQAGPTDTHWLGGDGSFFTTGKWSDGVPGTYEKPGPTYNGFSLTQFTGPSYFWSEMTINSGTAEISPGIRLVYNIIGVPDERYSTYDYVDSLQLPTTVIGQSGHGGLNATGGIFLGFQDLILGEQAGSSGTMTSTGAPHQGAIINVSSVGDTVVGAGGIGRWNLLEGSVAYYPDETYQREEFVSVWTSRVGEKPGSNGYITINGPGSRLAYHINYFGADLQRTTGLFIGEGGVGGVKVENGGSLAMRATRVGVRSTGEGFLSVTGTGSRIDNDSHLLVGEYGKGSLSVTNGGLLRSGYGDFRMGTTVALEPADPVLTFTDYGSIGKYAGSEGSVLVNGSTSRWENNANLVVGESGKGSLAIEGGTVVSAFRSVAPGPGYADQPSATLGLKTGSNGTVSVKGTGGRWQNGSPIIVGAAGTGKLIVGSGGTVDVGGSGLVLLGQTGNGTLVMGGDNAAGVGTLGGTLVQGGTGTSAVQFQHNLSSYSATHRYHNLSSIQNIGPGKTVVPQRVTNIGALSASAGILEIAHSAATNTADYLGAVTGGKLVINGSAVSTPDVQFPRTLVGLNGSGEVSVINGGTLTTSLQLGGSTGGIGRLSVEGEGSRVVLRESSLPIGGLGTAAVTLKSGGRISGINPLVKLPVTLGESATGNGSLTMSGSNTQLITGTLTVGAAGRATIYADDPGTLLQSDVSVIGAQPTGDGSVRLGNSVRWYVNSDELLVGGGGSGVIELSTGSTLRVGPTGTGDLILGNQSTGVGILRIGSNGLPGNLLARQVVSGLAGPSGAQVRVNHRSPNHTLSPAFFEVDFRLVSGNLGTTTLTAPGSFLSRASVTSGGLRLAGGGGVYMDDEIIIGDGQIFDMDESSLPFLEVDGPNSLMDAANGIMVGKSGAGEVRLKNGGTLRVRNNIHQAENSVILGDDAANNFGTSTFVFGGSAATAPGVLDAWSIHSYAREGKVTFSHSAPNFVMPASLNGNLSVTHAAGTTLLTNTYQGYSGATSVTGGTFLVTANLSSIVTLTNSAVFGGLGTTSRVNAHSGSTLSPGTFRPGEEIASMRVTALNFFGGSRVRIDMGPNLTCDRILNHKVGTVTTTLFPVTSGTVTFDFRNRGIDRNGAYPVLTTTNSFNSAFMSRLAFTLDFPLQGSFRQTPVTSGGVSYHQLEFVVTGFDSAYATWAQSFGLDPTGDGAPDQDPDHDGLKNLVEHVLGSSPVSGVPAKLPTVELTDSSLIFSFTSQPDILARLEAKIEYSTDMRTWTVATPPAVQSFNISGRGVVTTATLPRPTDGKPLFARLRVTENAP